MTKYCEVPKYVVCRKLFFFQVESFRVLVLRHLRLIIHEFFSFFLIQTTMYILQTYGSFKSNYTANTSQSMNSIVRKHGDGYTSIMHSGDDFIDGRLIFVTTTEWKHGHEGTNCSDGAIRIIDYICVCFTAKVFCVHTLQSYSEMQLKVNLTDIRFPLRGFTEHQMEHYWKVAINCANPGPTK